MNPVVLHGCVSLGAAGYQLSPSSNCTLFFSAREVNIQTPQRACFQIPLLELCELRIAGPGSVTTGGGFVGGGFGFEGALEGMAIAGILNALTSTTKIHTFISLSTNVGEMHFHYSSMEPAALRIALTEIYMGLRKQDPEWQDQRLAVLRSALQRKEIDEERFAFLAQRLEQSCEVLPTPITIPNHSGTLEGYAQVRAQQPKAQCPSCDCILPATTEVCPHCSANLGPGASWTAVDIVRHVPAKSAIETLSRNDYTVHEVSGGWRIQQDGEVAAYAMTEDDLAALSQLSSKRMPLAMWFADLLSEQERVKLFPTVNRKRRMA